MTIDKKLINEGSIDFKYFFKKLSLNKKKIIFYVLLSSFLTTLISTIPLFFSKKILYITLPYTEQLSDLGHNFYCKNDTRCSALKTADIIIQNLGKGWNKNLDIQNKALYVISELPIRLSYGDSPDSYIFTRTDELKDLKNKLNKIEEIIRNNQLKQQVSYLNTIKETSDSEIVSTETFVSSLLNTKKAIGLLDAGIKPIKFKDFYISDVKIKPSLNFSNPFEIEKIDYGESSKNLKMNLLRNQRNRLVAAKINITFLRNLIIFFLLIPTIIVLIEKKEEI